MTLVACPDTEALAALLQAESDEAVAEYSDHLEHCARCQQTVARLADDGTGWQEIDGLLPRAVEASSAPEPALSRVMARLKSESALVPGSAIVGGEWPDLPLSLLAPTDRPGLLGTVGGYEVQEVIGRGGMGVVFRAFDAALHRSVAIKVMSTSALIGNHAARQRFLREAQAAAAVRHEHIVTVHAVREAAGLPYLVMQYVPGESLQARLERTGPLETREIVRIAMQAASGLAAAHARGLIHRDIKPANLLLEGDPARVRITDFGLARTADDAPLTQSGVVAGTPEYMAPEQARGEAVDRRADLFSLGSVMYAMCTGVPPYRGPTPLAVLGQVGERQPAPVRSLNPNVPAWLNEFVARLMARDPAERFQTAAEVATLLDGYLAHLSEPATVDAPRLPTPPRAPFPAGPTPRRRLLLGLLAGAGLACVLGLLGAAGLLARAVPAVDPADGAAAAPAPEPKSPEPANDLVCLLVNKNSGRCLSIAGGSTDPGARIVQGPRPEQAGAAERWTLLGPSPAFRLRNEKSLLVLEIGSANPNHGVQAIQWHDKTSAPQQQWTFEPVVGGYLLRVGHSQQLLSIREGSQDADAQAIQWDQIPDDLDQCWELRPPYRREHHWPLKGAPEGGPPWALVGPDAEQYVRFEPGGLRIAFPASEPKEHPDTGVSISTPVKGDFEITLSFEVLRASAGSGPANEARLTLNAMTDGAAGDIASLSRQSGVGPGARFLAWMRRRDEATGKDQVRAKERRTNAKAGRLRMVRAGSGLSYYASQGDDGPFTFVERFPFGDRDVNEISVTGATAGAEASLDARVTDLRIRADSLPALPLPEAPDGAAAPARGSWLWAILGVAAAAVLAMVASLGAWRSRLLRRGREAISWPCPACAKKLRVKAALAGRRVKCPHCGTPSAVPEL
jgi:hypothetical protein